MPTLPLMTPSTHADASRLVAAPGGYEWWRFDASSDDGRLHVVAMLHRGDAFDPHYLRRYARYRRRPTRAAPPLPAEYPSVTFALLEQGRPPLRLSARATVKGSHVIGEEFHAADDGRTVRIGASHFTRGSDGVFRLHLRGVRDERTISVNLSFRPQLQTNCAVDLAPPPPPPPEEPLGFEPAAARSDGSAGIERTHDRHSVAEPGGAGDDRASGDGGAPALAHHRQRAAHVPRAAGGAHEWIVVAPLCDVDGEISLFAESGGPPRLTAFAGVGCHDHRFGTRALRAAADHWLAGRALFEDRAILFQCVGPRSYICRAGPGGAGKSGLDVAHSGAPRDERPAEELLGVSLDELPGGIGTDEDADRAGVGRLGGREPAITPSHRGDHALHITPAGLRIDGHSTTRWGVSYPDSIELPGDVRLLRPRVVGATLATTTIAYDAVGDAETGRALVEVVKARRLGWATR